MRLLLLNPNASVHITERMAASARAALAPGSTLQTLTNTQGPAFVHDAATLAQAEAQALQLMREHAAPFDALVLGISLDGLAGTLRPLLAPRPVLGMTEAAVAAAALAAPRVGLLTLGPAMAPLYEARLAALLPAGRIGGVAAPDLPAAFAPGSTIVDPAVLHVLANAASRLGAGALVLAGAVLCGYGRALSAITGRPVFDGVECAVRRLQAAQS